MFSLNWFGGGSAAKKKDMTKKAIIDLREQLEMLRKRETFLEKQIQQQEEVARKNVSSNKNVAMAALKRKKLHEQALVATQGQMTTVEQQIHSIETANLNAEMLRVMKDAGKAMKEIHQGMDIDKVEQTMEDIRDQRELAGEITEALSRGAVTDPLDEDELLAELDELQKEQLDNKMLAAPGVPVTTGKVPTPVKQQVEEDDEEEELRKLQAEMAA